MKLKQIRIEEVLVAIKNLYPYLTAVLSKALSVILPSAIAMEKVIKNGELTIVV